MNPPAAASDEKTAPAPAAALPPPRPSIAAAILTDVHFWVPIVVLGLGVGLLILLS